VPIITNGLAGAVPAASAFASIDRVITLGADAEAFTIDLLVKGLPSIFVYVIQTAGALPTTVNPQFSVRSRNNAPDYLSLPGFTVTTGGQQAPAVQNYQVSSQFFRLGFTRAPGQATTIRFIVTASV
jgi:hypothetical protein